MAAERGGTGWTPEEEARLADLLRAEADDTVFAGLEFHEGLRAGVRRRLEAERQAGSRPRGPAALPRPRVPAWIWGAAAGVAAGAAMLVLAVSVRWLPPPGAGRPAAQEAAPAQQPAEGRAGDGRFRAMAPAREAPGREAGGRAEQPGWMAEAASAPSPEGQAGAPGDLRAAEGGVEFAVTGIAREAGETRVAFRISGVTAPAQLRLFLERDGAPREEARRLAYGPAEGGIAGEAVFGLLPAGAAGLRVVLADLRAVRDGVPVALPGPWVVKVD